MVASGGPAPPSARAWSSPAPAVTSWPRWSTTSSTVRTLSGDKTAKAKKVGELVADRAKSAGLESVVFDRAGNKYHGRVAALAEGAREGGLSF